MPWILWSSGGVSVLGITFLVLWIWLPRWAPEWVIKHSPWVDPVLRAMAVSLSDRSRPMDGNLIGEFKQRITAWGAPARPEVISGLESSNPNLRLACVFALTDFNERSPHPELIQAKLIAVALADENDEIRNHAYFALTPEHSLRMSEVRARAMKDGEDWVRYSVVAELDSRNSDLDFLTLMSALHDSDWDNRRNAVKRVEELNEVRAVSRLIDMVPTRDDPLGVEHEAVLAVVFSALAHFKVAEALPVLAELIEIQNAWDGPHIPALFKTITMIDAEEGFRVRVKILQEAHVGARAFVAQELGESGNPRAIGPLTKQLQDPEPLVFGYVVIALSHLKATSSIETILDRLEARRADLIDLETRQQEGVPIVSGRLMRISFSDLVDQVATMPLTSEQRERLERVREE